MSKSNGFPQGLANSSGMVGRNLMFNSGAFVGGRFESEVNGYKGVVNSRLIHDFYELDPSLGISGGGGLDVRFDFQPIAFALYGQGDPAPRWGAEFKRKLHERFTRTAYVLGHTTSLPVETNSISLDPTVKDEWGLPAIRLTFKEHPNDHKLSQFFTARAIELIEAAGAVECWPYPAGAPPFPQVHLLGTCRMGNDPKSSVVNSDHRAHDVRNLFLVDGSSFVTSGRGQPTMTIQALAFRAAERMGELARRGEL
jgi:choline dehydrogenase-like flavoprotein